MIIDQYQCVKADCRYLQSIGDLKFSHKSGLVLVLCCTYMLLLYVSVCTYLHLFTNQVPNTPECPMTPLEQMEKDDMRRLHPTLPSNADLIAAGNNSIELTEEQHRILMSQSEGSTILYRSRENGQRVEGTELYLGITDEERNALNVAHDTLQLAARLEGTNANPGQERIMDLVQPGDPPIFNFGGICARTRELATVGPILKRNIRG